MNGKGTRRSVGQGSNRRPRTSLIPSRATMTDERAAAVPAVVDVEPRSQRSPATHASPVGVAERAPSQSSSVPPSPPSAYPHRLESVPLSPLLPERPRTRKVERARARREVLEWRRRRSAPLQDIESPLLSPPGTPRSLRGTHTTPVSSLRLLVLPAAFLLPPHPPTPPQSARQLRVPPSSTPLFRSA